MKLHDALEFGISFLSSAAAGKPEWKGIDSVPVDHFLAAAAAMLATVQTANVKDRLLKEGNGDLLVKVPDMLILDKCFHQILESTPPKAFFEWIHEMEAAIIDDLHGSHGNRVEHLD
jgi:hypothetical protein